MKFKTIRKWKPFDGDKGLLFVAQLLDELLFEYTLDTYQPSAMNTSLLIKEAFSTISAIESGTIRSPNLKYILKELSYNLKRDSVARALSKINLDDVCSTLQDPKTDQQSLKVILELLANQINLRAYKSTNEDMLKRELVGGQDYSTLRSLTRSYVTTLLNFGFSQSYVKYSSEQYFFFSEGEITDVDDINNYFSLFAREKTEYRVYYPAPLYLSEFTGPGAYLDIEVLNDVPQEIVKLEIEDFGKDFEVYLKVEKIKARDCYSAKSRADHKVESLQTLVALFHHKESPVPLVDGVVFDEGGSSTVVRKSINPMHKCNDMKIGTASKKLSDFMSSFRVKGESFVKFNRCAELHALALASESRENQLVNLWIALESIIPNKTNEKISQIEHIIYSVTPFLNITYLPKILDNFSKDLWRRNSRTFKDVLKEIEGDGTIEKVSKLMAFDEHKELRDRIKENFSDFHLLSERFKYIEYLLSVPANTKKSIDAHNERIGWQIRRIYRARNLIVHDGKTPSYTDILIENLHDYLDCVMNAIMKLSTTQDTLDSIDQAFKMVEIMYESFQKSIGQKKLEYSNENIKHLLVDMSDLTNKSSRRFQRS